MVNERIKVAIVQSRLHHFRVPFYEKLRDLLAEKNVELKLIYGQPNKFESAKNDAAHLDWAVEIKNIRFRKGPVELLWQPCWKYVQGCDLIVVQQENRMLMNYVLLLFRQFLKTKIAFWGHGINCQAKKLNGIKEQLKRRFLKAPDWWFAYTDFTKEVLVKEGYSETHITLVQNAVDTSSLKAHLDSLSESETTACRSQLGIEGRHVGIYCGSLYDLKKIDFLIQAACEVKRELADFELVIIGDGVDRPIAEAAQQEYSWIHFIGAKYGREQALYMNLGDVALMPGLVGLGIVDSFLFGMPLITTDCKCHSPEIAYLEQGRNGYMTENTLEAYSAKIVEVLKDEDQLRTLSANCREDARQYTIENMAANFSEGILRALKLASAPEVSA